MLNPKSYILNSNFSGKGFTLIEVIIYIAVIGAVLIIIALIINNIFFVFGGLKAQSEAINNGEIALKTMIEEIKKAAKIYTPTSSSGQLSLKTNYNLPADETYTYLDFYLDNGKIYLKREGASTQALTTDRVFVNSLNFAYLPAVNSTSVKVSLNLKPNIAGIEESLKNAATFTGSANLRNAQ